MQLNANCYSKIDWKHLETLKFYILNYVCSNPILKSYVLIIWDEKYWFKISQISAICHFDYWFEWQLDHNWCKWYGSWSHIDHTPRKYFFFIVQLVQCMSVCEGV